MDYLTGLATELQAQIQECLALRDACVLRLVSKTFNELVLERIIASCKKNGAVIHVSLTPHDLQVLEAVMANPAIAQCIKYIDICCIYFDSFDPSREPPISLKYGEAYHEENVFSPSLQKMKEEYGQACNTNIPIVRCLKETFHRLATLSNISGIEIRMGCTIRENSPKNLPMGLQKKLQAMSIDGRSIDSTEHLRLLMHVLAQQTFAVDWALHIVMWGVYLSNYKEKNINLLLQGHMAGEDVKRQHDLCQTLSKLVGPLGDIEIEGNLDLQEWQLQLSKMTSRFLTMKMPPQVDHNLLILGRAINTITWLDPSSRLVDHEDYYRLLVYHLGVRENSLRHSKIVKTLYAASKTSKDILFRVEGNNTYLSWNPYLTEVDDLPFQKVARLEISGSFLPGPMFLESTRKLEHLSLKNCGISGLDDWSSVFKELRKRSGFLEYLQLVNLTQSSVLSWSSVDTTSATTGIVAKGHVNVERILEGLNEYYEIMPDPHNGGRVFVAFR
ncbi:unnamed protein product [Periconia digitata]|uniref:F-box domain-containing protein n=1 Tax=Periconia digitata TaxID=1303443 RepID=A0A9W4UW43_9PLEO|nr:unnamed protein product [Periconia digitata]